MPVIVVDHLHTEVADTEEGSETASENERVAANVDLHQVDTGWMDEV